MHKCTFPANLLCKEGRSGRCRRKIVKMMINGNGGEKGVIRSNVVPVTNQGEVKHKATAIYLPWKGLNLPGTINLRRNY